MSFPILSRALAACMLLLLGAAAQAQVPAWPAKPVRLVVGFPPGGIVDTVARQLQPRLQAALGQTVIVDNRSGAGGTLAAAEVARAAPDGHTLLMVFDSYATYPLVYPKLSFDIAKDLQPVTQVASNPLVLVVNPKVQAKDFQRFVGLLKAQPGGLNYASVGPGSSNHLTAEYFKAVSGTFVTHIPYRGGGPAQQDLLGGQVEMMFLSAVLAQPHVNAGRLRALAQTGAQRVAAYAEVPTVAESGYPGFEVNSWVGLLAPAGTPRAVVDRLQAEVRKAVTEPAFQQRLREQGLTGIANTPEQFAAVLRTEQDKWTRLVRDRRLSLE
ncbi:tripartite-type tricarboxylate transporter receptor subunit TctC [Variovorax beijingensis]|uniref:Tripartite-type tricarboxylate transporter receptor subunit TctC n=2 Tax=Variovorax TaxID=34072 RepID=A0AAE3Y350_VARPD|nr:MULTISPECIES: tripartite tricarboxylate transporter substrate binding protein [Variovorax]MDP9968636.1 tripartite-type tricarboxylate transporter receptor subunit TctC [Variovorax paradoxus]MDR6430213.1 tripartite-type tricarboxylate transporter receptor subunit TctC [Variovorax paradoxus]MDR6456267.1 tripartite-type tricarboxylate transporter receptor subunit TctC [Variovorax paradoxus]TWD76132.1 tripartite-type tricarboxylate transporter receptor subunit TctC [Variovorax beijingensis]